jgi:hypothetical protein
LDGEHAQFTPLLEESFETTAVMGGVALTCKADGGVGSNETRIGRVMATSAETNTALLATEVAVMATLPPEGGSDGAVYVVVLPLAVCVGLNEPQEFAGVQLQLTPASEESFVTTAASEAVLPTCSDCGGAVWNAIEMLGVVPEPDPDPPPHPAIAEARKMRTIPPIPLRIVIAATSP